MMKLKTKIIIAASLIFFLGRNAMGQISDIKTVCDELICKDWKLISFEEDGEKFPPSADQVGDRMRFQFDQKVKYIEMSKMNYGVWKYDPASNDLVIINTETKEEKYMKVLKLTNDDIVLEYNKNGLKLKMYMIAVAGW